MERVHRMRAIRCERDVLDRLLTIEQVRTARIDTEQSTIEYLSFDGTTDGPQSFPMGSKVGDIVLGLGWSCAEVVVGFLSCSAALHLHRGRHESDLDEFLALIREFKPDNRASEWMAVMLNVFQKAAIFPSTRESSRKRQGRSELFSSCSSDSDAS